MKLEIKKAGINGEGIGFCKRKPVFVEGCFPGETVECDIVDEGRHCRGTLKKSVRKVLTVSGQYVGTTENAEAVR